jgi:hypothetical protein
MKLLQSNPTMTSKSTLNCLARWAIAVLFGANSLNAIADDSQWTFSSSIFLNTRAEGANLPESATEIDFPVLIRLHKDFFDFNSAASNGQDIRFEFEGKNLPYKIDHWDASNGSASIWVLMPKIQGNRRAEIKVLWGNPNAPVVSSGSGVFKASNHYLSVLHMDDTLMDDVGLVTTKDLQTTSTLGRIGSARHLMPGQGILCGEQIEGLPKGSDSHSSEAWIRPEKTNGRILGWGNEHAQGKVIMHFRSPPHVEMECYFSGANVSSLGSIPLDQWTHILHTYEKGDSKIYINGELSNTSKTSDAPLAIKSPARFYIGGWYNHYDYFGDIDEVRVSNTVRSADWAKLQYENQKEFQTLSGIVVQPGNQFSVSAQSAIIDEGSKTTFEVKALGAQKIYWILKKDQRESVLHVDRFRVEFDPGRVAKDESVVLQCKAIYPEGIRTQDIDIKILERIPEPSFTLSAPASWNGRDTIEIIPNISNLDSMKAAGAGAIDIRWKVGPLALIKEFANGKLLLKRSQQSGPLDVTATISNGGLGSTESIRIDVKEPAKDSWVFRTPEDDEKPQEGQFYSRDDQSQGTLYYNGQLDANITTKTQEVFLRLYADEKLVHSETTKLDADRRYRLSAKLKAGLIKYRIEFGIDQDQVLDSIGDIVCGDAYLIDGQSNALATDTHEKSPPETNTWIRSYAKPSDNAKDNEGNLWVLPVWKAQNGQRAELGWWAMELAKRLVDSQKVPIFMINAAVGGTRIDQHQRNAMNPTDLSSIYGRMLWRIREAKLTHGIRAILWHQGENDQGSDGPTGGYGWETYHEYFVDMAAGWKQDFPNVQRYYVFQIWPNSCSMGGRQGSGDMLREKQRQLEKLFSNMSILSTLGVEPEGGCHFPLEGWGKFAQMAQPLIERDFYNVPSEKPLTAPNLCRASFNNHRDTIELEFDQPIQWQEQLAREFYLDGVRIKEVRGSATGKVLTLKLSEPTGATTITYLKEIDWRQDRLLKGINGLAALTFCNVPIEIQPRN